MTESVSSAIDIYRHRLEHLDAEGRQLRAALATAPESAALLRALAVWQRECAATVSQLSGGTKVHWLARAFSEALLVPNANGNSASVVTIVDRLLSVLDSANRSLDEVAALPSPPADGSPPARSRFTFIENVSLRSGLERAYLDGQNALARGEFALAMVTFCSVLETVITDALERRGLEALTTTERPAGAIVEWPFSMRIAVAERAGLISRGCARLSQAGREYREHGQTDIDLVAEGSISARDAKLASDVLHIVLRDLAPGR